MGTVHVGQWFPTFFVWRAIYFLWRALRATRLIFCIPSPLLPPFSSHHSPPVQQLGVLGSAVNSPSGVWGGAPADNAFLSILGLKIVVSDMFREVLQRSKQLEIFRFLPRISYFHHNGHSGSYPTGLPCQNGNFAVVAHIFLKFFRRSRATFWGLAGHFRPTGHRLGTTDVGCCKQMSTIKKGVII